MCDKLHKLLCSIVGRTFLEPCFVCVSCVK